jgi:hypothetical protein
MEERNNYLKTLYSSDPQTYKQVVDLLTAYANGSPPQG